MPDSRKLTAIMFTDIKDFSRRMNADEKSGMRLLETHNLVMDAVLAAHGGTLIKNIGDAYMVDFSSAVDALEAAVQAQERFAELNRGVGESDELLVRISIHLGDVVMRGGDLFGDGVNIAQRLQAITPAGGICMSREVHHHVKGKVDCECASIGTFGLKGVSDPVEVYQVGTPLAPLSRDRSAAATSSGGIERDAPERSIAVLPFANHSDEKDSEYFSDGITEDIITDLAKNREIRVTSRNSVFTFKGKGATARQVGGALHVRYVLEGSVRRAGRRIRITAQLIDVRTDAHLWAERFDRDLSDVFAVQDEIARAIAGELSGRLQSAGRVPAATKESTSPAAYDLYLKGLYHRTKRTARDLDLAEKYLCEALRADEGFAPAHAVLAWVYRYKWANGFERTPATLALARDHASRALSISPDHPDALLMKGLLERDDGRLVDSLATLAALVESNPSHAQGHAYLGNAYRDAGMGDEARRHHAIAAELDPMDFMNPVGLVQDLMVLGQFLQTREHLARAAEMAPDYAQIVLFRASQLAIEGDTAAADRMIEAIVQDEAPPSSAGLRAAYLVYRGRYDEAVDYYRQSFIPALGHPVVPLLFTRIMLALRLLDEAEQVIERALSTGASQFSDGLELRTHVLYCKGMLRRLRGDEHGARGAFEASLAEAHRWRRVFPRSPTIRAAWAVALALTGNHADAMAEITAIERDHPTFAMIRYHRAVVCVEAGDRGGMLSALKDFRAGGGMVVWGILGDPAFARYREDADFLALAGSSEFHAVSAAFARPVPATGSGETQ